MDFRKIRCISESCKDKNVIMDGAGGSITSRITMVKVRCPECGTTLLIIPMSKEYEYEVRTTTVEERRQAAIDKATEESNKKLEKHIEQIKNTNL